MKWVWWIKKFKTEIKKDKANYWKNTVEKRNQKYLLAPKILFEGKDGSFTKKIIDY